MENLCFLLVYFGLCLFGFFLFVGHRKQRMCDNREGSACDFPVSGAEPQVGLFQVMYDIGISLCKGYSSGLL